MKVTVRDSEILKTIEPSVLEAHLKISGWHQTARIYENNGAIWRRSSGSTDAEEFEILLPLKTSLGDYAARICDALKTLEIVEKRSQLDILSDLLTHAANIEIQGMVIEIQSSDSTGTVTLMGVIVGKLRKINVSLKQSEYTLAIKAYKERLPVICTGDLIKEGNSFVLQNLRNFALDIG